MKQTLDESVPFLDFKSPCFSRQADTDHVLGRPSAQLWKASVDFFLFS